MGRKGRGQTVELASYDGRLLTAAQALGVPTAALWTDWPRRRQAGDHERQRICDRGASISGGRCPNRPLSTFG